MKSLLIPAFVATAAVSAAELQDPVDVRLDWNRAVVEAKESTKVAITPAHTASTEKSSTRTYDIGFDKPVVIYRRRPPVQLYDAPNYRPLNVPPYDRPRGAKPWEFNGEIYWIVPLSPAKTI